MENKIIKIQRAEIKSVDVEKKTVTAIVSHAKKDRDGDVIPPEAMKKRIKNYKAHPVLQANHSYSVENTIGKCNKIDLNDDHVECTFEYFAGIGNPTADFAFELAKKGLAAYSIGFQSFGFDWIEEKQEDGTKRTTGRKFNDIELLEISHVAIPANPLALQAMLDDEKTGVEIKEVCGLVLKGIKDGEIKAVEATKDAQPPVQQQQGELERRMSACEATASQAMQKVALLENEVTALTNKVNALEAMEQDETDETEQPAKHYSRKLFEAEANKPIPTSQDKPKGINVAELVKEALKNVITGDKK